MFFEKMKLKQRVGELEDQLRLAKAERDAAYEQAKRANALADEALKELNGVRKDLMDTKAKLDAAEDELRELREKYRGIGGRFRKEGIR